MKDTTPPRATVNANATITMRLRPSLMLMIVRLRAAEATLELSLATVKQQSLDAVRRLTRLGAARVDIGEPHADDHAEADPMAKMRAAAMHLRRSPETPTTERRGVNITLTAVWDIKGQTVEEVLFLVDRLRFDAAVDTDPMETENDVQPWAGPEEQLLNIMAQAGNPSEDRTPKFLYIAQPTEEQLSRAATEAHEAATQQARRLANAAGRTLGELSSLHLGTAGSDGRTDKIMERQRCAALLAASSYDLRDGEVASDDPRASDTTLTLYANFLLGPTRNSTSQLDSDS